VDSYRRRLPHWHSLGQPLFLTWRLHGSLPPHRTFPPSSLTSGKAFVALDRLLDQSRTGPLYLSQHPSQPAIAQLVWDALHYGQTHLQHYILHAFVVMPNHVHVLLTPQAPVPKLLCSLKGITAKRANQLLGLTGQPFWQEESYDHLVRDSREMARIRAYIEENPVRAGLAATAKDYRWSSAGQGAGSGPGGPPYPLY
jgi:putative transposase